jgi:hypothetical protein
MTDARAHDASDRVPNYRCVGCRLRRVLTRRACEFHATFEVACRECGMQHTRTRSTKPRRTWALLHHDCLHHGCRLCGQTPVAVCSGAAKA